MFEHLLSNKIGPHKITVSECEILVNLTEQPRGRMRMRDLAVATGQTPSRLSHQVSRMEKDGLVWRDNARGILDSAGRDKRAIYPSITDFGREVLERTIPSYEEAVRQMFISFVSAETLSNYDDLFGALSEHLRRSLS
ncbi:MarR family transcriptional regulator [Streptomyces sp. NPDC051909]|uniref:MarR family winged helix-turn-helix transcriptional regulator n=1 Tax=Streptomyces sp. NPDC051909 TaxID=3154944 RepID=UPI00341D22ED